MSTYQHIFSTNAVLNVWRNLRNTRAGDPNDLLLTLQYQPDEGRTRQFGGKGKGKGKGNTSGSNEVERTDVVDEVVGGGGGGGGRSIGFVVPWRSMQAQKRELREKEKVLAEALVVLAGEVAFTDLSPTLQSSLSTNPLIQTRHICAGLSRQISALELQMADNAPFYAKKNLYTGGEIARKFLPPIEKLFEQRPVPQRMIFELLMELKDVVFMAMEYCDEETGEWEAEGWNTFEVLDGVGVRSLVELSSSSSSSSSREEQGDDEESLPHTNGMTTTTTKTTTTINGGRRFLKRNPSTLFSQPQSQSQLLLPSSSSSSTHASLLQQQHHHHPPHWPLTTPTPDLLHLLESLETTSTALSHLTPPIPDFLAATTLTLRRMLDRRTLHDFSVAKKKRTARCAEYARCMKWAGVGWRERGGCRRGCKNDDDEGVEALPSWHRGSRWFV
ncbi:hypothetical protein K504DRAFT_532861 [Pleomassaria siparia CBS 279.74]|uniref:Uncharacterized protein n=1 Tax=Pleomassaria siparia CBS 279.74 TaxID=1314801 RepID=A0A6G1KEH6_9PLEO|nr:hypothetical protein K504DRAFT_532861 [Pleomassaria siparia CBS 279.74]